MFLSFTCYKFEILRPRGLRRSLFANVITLTSIFEGLSIRDLVFWKSLLISGPILENKGMHAIFQKKGKESPKKMLKKGGKGQNIWKFGQKYTKFENILKKGRWLSATIRQNKLLENALHIKLFIVLKTCKANRLLTGSPFFFNSQTENEAGRLVF